VTREIPVTHCELVHALPTMCRPRFYIE
jgi:hypothetical protein